MAIEGKKFVALAGLGFFTIVGLILIVAGRNQRYSAGHSGALLIAEALDRYREDNGFYPTEAQGLGALIAKSNADPTPGSFAKGGYVDERILVDPWGHPYHYRVPGAENPESFDVWTQGRDGAPGGGGIDRDLGNFPAAPPS
jgi:general secretion pathway protein G